MSCTCPPITASTVFAGRLEIKSESSPEQLAVSLLFYVLILSFKISVWFVMLHCIPIYIF